MNARPGSVPQVLLRRARSQRVDSSGKGYAHDHGRDDHREDRHGVGRSWQHAM